MLMLIDRHSSELQNLADNLDHSVEIQDLASVETATEELLKNIFGNWYQIQEQDLHQLKSDLLATQPRDNHQEILLQIVNISLEAYPEQARFYQDTQALAEHFSQEVIDVSDDLQNMPEEDLLEWASYRHWSGDLPEIQEQATHFLEQVYSAIYNQGLITTAARTVHEVVLYYFLGKHAAENKKLVIGLDLDHNSWMDQSWKLGYNYDHQDNSTLAQDQPTGILYARKPDITLTDEEADLSPVQVYLNRYQYNQEGSQSLSNFWLREEWDLNHSH